MQLVNLFDYEALARERTDPAVWDYVAGGAGDEVTLRENRAAFDRFWLRPRMLVDVSTCDLTTTVLGTPVSAPILVAPTAYHALLHPDDELATVRGTGAAGTVMVASSFATRRLEEIAEAATGPLWFQLYVYAERRITEGLVRRAEAAGYRALVLTVDLPRLGNRERDVRNGFALPPHLQRSNFVEFGLEHTIEVESGSDLATHAAANMDASLTWEALDWLRSLTKLPVLVKGILTAEDAALALEHDVAGIIVSNHGGRQLDGVQASIVALPEVVEAVRGRCEVYVDGGIRRGTDVLKALALGARAVLVGRPVLWGLVANGADGVQAVLTMLRDELELAMALAGRPTLPSIDSSTTTRLA